MASLLGVWARCALLGAGVYGALVWLGARTLVSTVAADAATCGSVGRVTAIAAWLYALASFRFLSDARSRPQRFLLVTTSALAVAASVSLLAGLGSEMGAEAAPTESNLGFAFAEAVLLSILSACLFETIQEARVLVAWFVTITWAIPALLGGGPGDPLTRNAGAGNLESLVSVLPFGLVAAALVAALVAMRPRFRG